MCQYFKKLHTCGCISKCYLSMCRPGILSNSVCTPLEEPPDDPNTCRKSYFPCYNCILKEARAEILAKMETETDPTAAQQMAAKAQRFADKQEKYERVRREAAEKARTEREQAEREREKKRVEAERAKKEGGLWIDAGSVRKKGRKGGAGMDSVPPTPISAPPFVGGRKMGEFGKKEVEPPKSATAVGAGGRAGGWGPGAVKKAGEKEKENGAWRPGTVTKILQKDDKDKDKNWRK